MSPEDRAWEMAGLARMDGDHEEERRWTQEAMRLSGREHIERQPEPEMCVCGHPLFMHVEGKKCVCNKTPTNYDQCDCTEFKGQVQKEDA